MVLDSGGAFGTQPWGGLSTTGTRPSPFDHIGLRVRCGDVGGGRMDSPFVGGFLAGASPFPRSDYPRSGRGSSVEWPHRCKIRNRPADLQRRIHNIDREVPVCPSTK